MTLDDVRRARTMARAGRVMLEVSGGVTLETRARDRGDRRRSDFGRRADPFGAKAVDLSMRIEASA